MIVYIFNSEKVYENICATLDANIEEQYKNQFTSIAPNPIFLINKWNDTEWIEGATQEEIQAEKNKNAFDYIKSKYETHKKNGWDAYQNFRAKIIIDISEGLITEQQAFLIEKDLKIAYDRIAQNGDWKTAYFELSQVTASQPFVQPYLTMALGFIGQYIQKNYDS